MHRRFLEVLQAACVPVLLSNGWELPFSEVIDWNRVVVWGDERLLLQVPSMVRGLSQPQIVAMRQQTQLLWETYFSSVEKIVAASLEVMRDRIYRHVARPVHVWNSSPGAVYLLTDFSDAWLDYPFFYRRLGATPLDRFTAVVYATSPVTPASALFRLLRNVSRSAYVHKIIVLWHCDVPPPPSRRWPADLGVPVLVKTRNIKSVNARFVPYKEIETDAVFGLEEDAMLTTEEIDFAFSAWLEFPERIVGYPARGHYWDEERGRWRYSSKWANDYSMVLTGAAVYHRLASLYHATQPAVPAGQPAALPCCQSLQQCSAVPGVIQLTHAAPNDSPVLFSAPNDSPVLFSAPNDSPVLFSAPNDSPVLFSAPNDSPVLFSAPNDSPVLFSAPNDSPVLFSAPNDSPVLFSAPNDSPVLFSAPNDSPVLFSAPNDSPVLFSAPNDSPVLFSAPNDSPVLFSAPNDSPVLFSAPNDSPVLFSAPNDSPVLYYNHLYTHYTSKLLTQRVEAANNCHHILLNFLVSHVTRRPPVKLTQRKQYRQSALTEDNNNNNNNNNGGGEAGNGSSSRAGVVWEEHQRFWQRQTCMEEFVSVLGYMPLLRTRLRMDPLLFKDPVSNLRKKYRRIELVVN
ncbi:hypothetical protein ACOMHN_043706 [Nucella lapillus]